jgi:pimeloyl-ACP methyl ester carboxylesterase
MRDGAGSYELSTTLANAEYWQHVCALWPSAGATADYGPAAVSDTPVLILNGTADPQDPPGNMAGAARLWPNSRQVAQPHQSHHITQWTCHESIIDTFIDHGSTHALNTRCVTTVPLPAFSLTTG